MMWYKIHLSFVDALDKKKDIEIQNRISDFSVKNSDRSIELYANSISRNGLTLFVRSDNTLLLDLLKRDYNLQTCDEPDTRELNFCFGVAK